MTLISSLKFPPKVLLSIKFLFFGDIIQIFLIELMVEVDLLRSISISNNGPMAHAIGAAVPLRDHFIEVPNLQYCAARCIDWVWVRLGRGTVNWPLRK